MAGANVPKWQKVTAIPGMLIFGTATVVTQKFLFEQKSIGLDKYGEHKFKKPWFQTNSMFIGMLLALLVYEVKRCIDKRKQSTESIEAQSITTNEIDPDEAKKSSQHWKMYLYVAAPSTCDLLATALSNIGLLYIQASVWQMLRGSMVLFSSIFCAFILKRPHFSYMWWSVLVVTVALGIVGAATVCSTGVGKAGVSVGQVWIAIFLTIGAQVIQATQIVVEDFLLHDMTASPILIVGLEGLWGTIITMCVFFPITTYIGGEEGNGLHEDTLDTLHMIANNNVLIIFVILYVFFILIYNIMGMFVTNITSAVVRTILEGLRTLCIWIVQIILFYSFQGSDYGDQHPGLGEEWTVWSWMQLAGFFLLFTGMLLYNRIVEVPFFKYPNTSKPETSQGNPDETPLIENK